MQVRVDRLAVTHTIDGQKFVRKVPSALNGSAGFSVTLADGSKRFFRKGAMVNVGGYVDPVPAGRTAAIVKGGDLTYDERQAMTLAPGKVHIPHSRKTRYNLSGKRATDDRYCRG